MVIALVAAACAPPPAVVRVGLVGERSVPWSIVLCKYRGVADEPRSSQYYRDAFAAEGDRESILDAPHYWYEQSGGAVDLQGTEVKGWYTTSSTRRQLQRRGADQRAGIVDACLEAAGADPHHPYRVPSDHRVIVVMNQPGDSGETGGRVLTNTGRPLTFDLHEMGHVLGLGHSFSTDREVANPDRSLPGEYDDEWDLMSAMGVHCTEATYGCSGPSLNAVQLSAMGWLPPSRLAEVEGGEAPVSTTLNPLHGTEPGYRQIRVPLSVANPDAGHVSVELRTADPGGWDAAIPATDVLFHLVEDGRSSLIRDTSWADRRPADAVDVGDLRITAVIDGDEATVSVQRRRPESITCTGGGSIDARIRPVGSTHYLEVTGFRWATTGWMDRLPPPGRCAWADRVGRGEERSAQRLVIAIDDRDQARWAAARATALAGAGTAHFNVFATPLTSEDPRFDPDQPGPVLFGPDLSFCCAL